MALLSGKKAVLFDHDGTLVDSEGIYHLLWCQLLGIDRTQFTLDMYKSHCVGVPTLGNAQYLVEQFKLKERPETLVSQRHKLTQSYLSDNAFPLMDGVTEVLALLSELQISAAIVSGSERTAVMNTVSRYHLTDYFKVIATGDQVLNNKPAPDVYIHCLTELGLSASECIAIEDTEHGVRAACEAGIEVIAIPNQFTLEHDVSKATHVFNSMRKLLELF